MSKNEEKKLMELIRSAKVSVTIKENGRWLGTAIVTLGNGLQIRGWRIGNSDFEENPFWIQPPSYGFSKNGKSFYSCWFNDKEMDATIKAKISEAYEEARMDEDEESIPF